MTRDDAVVKCATPEKLCFFLRMNVNVDNRTEQCRAPAPAPAHSVNPVGSAARPSVASFAPAVLNRFAPGEKSPGEKVCPLRGCVLYEAEPGEKGVSLYAEALSGS